MWNVKVLNVAITRPILDHKTVPNIMTTLWIVNQLEKHSTTLEHSFTVSMTIHSISLLSQLTMSSVRKHEDALSTRQLGYQLHSVQGRGNVQ